MAFTIATLFLSVLIGGLASTRVTKSNIDFQLPLVFAGSFLFSITIIHIIPELFLISEGSSLVGVYILIGFFFQRLLEYFSKGVEHGHTHQHGIESPVSRASVIFALTVHSLLEGSLLTHESPLHQQHESYSLLFGIALHKIPAAFALMVMLGHSKHKWLLLTIFSLASPVGLILSVSLNIAEHVMLVLFAIVSGSFLHISTTIFVETSPEHRFGVNKMIISIVGASLAILAEYII